MGIIAAMGKNAGLPTYSGTITQAQFTDTVNFDFRGGPGSSGGSASPPTLSNGQTIVAWYDNLLPTPVSTFVVSGFSADPGQNGFVVSVTAHGVTKTMASASSYSYSAGQAAWNWTSTFGFATTGTTAASVP